MVAIYIDIYAQIGEGNQGFKVDREVISARPPTDPDIGISAVKTAVLVEVSQPPTWPAAERDLLGTT